MSDTLLGMIKFPLALVLNLLKQMAHDNIIKSQFSLNILDAKTGRSAATPWGAEITAQVVERKRLSKVIILPKSCTNSERPEGLPAYSQFHLRSYV